MADRGRHTTQEDLCDHGCGLDATVQHADGRFLCYPCYRTEVEDADLQWRESGPCPTCRPKDEAGQTPLAGNVTPPRDSDVGLRSTPGTEELPGEDIRVELLQCLVVYELVRYSPSKAVIAQRHGSTFRSSSSTSSPTDD